MSGGEGWVLKRELGVLFKVRNYIDFIRASIKLVSNSETRQ